MRQPTSKCLLLNVEATSEGLNVIQACIDHEPGIKTFTCTKRVVARSFREWLETMISLRSR